MTSDHLRRAARVAAIAFVLPLLASAARAEMELGIPMPVPSPINEGGGYAYPWLTTDELTMYFATTAGSVGGTDIMVMTRPSIDASWSSPSNLGAPINTTLSDTFPSLTADGLELYFQRTSDPFTHADGELYVSRRASTSDPWGQPEALPFNSAVRDASPHISADGLTLYFDSTRPQEIYPYDFNTWVVTRPSRSDPFGEPTLFHPGLGFVTDDGLTHLFSVGPDGAAMLGVPNIGTDDLYVRTRASTGEDFGPVSILDAPVSTPGLDCCVALGVQDSHLYFTSSRPGAPSDGPVGFVNMWQAPLAKAVPVDVKPGDATPIDWNTETELPVAILSTAGFDALDVDVTSLLFGDPILIAGGAAPASPLSTETADVNGDGTIDLTLLLDVAAMRASGVISLESAQGYVVGKMLDRTVIAGRDAMSLVPEPGTAWILIVGCAAVAGLPRR